ncbi:MAG: glycosyltransferase family 1 protein [Gammaproteobacteria bacterium]
MKIAIVTDAWFPQINGVVTTLSKTQQELSKLGHETLVISPNEFRSFPCPTYPEIKLSLAPAKKLGQMMQAFQPDAVHIATEGPLGLAARGWCLKQKLPFTTSFHTRFPEYVKLRFHIPLKITYAFLRWFHSAAQKTMVATAALKSELEQRGMKNLVLWSRGVDAQLFRPHPKSFLTDARPIFIYMGRVAVEKNIEAYLKLDLPGTQYVVGDGPALDEMKQRYPKVNFTGFKKNEDLVRFIAAADVFVFPSRTDTFGLVIIEALACGVPVAAYPVRGPLDIIEQGVTGYLNEDLKQAALQALTLDGSKCRASALNYSWAACTKQFLEHLPKPDNLQPAVNRITAASR